MGFLIFPLFHVFKQMSYKIVGVLKIFRAGLYDSKCLDNFIDSVTVSKFFTTLHILQ